MHCSSLKLLGSLRIQLTRKIFHKVLNLLRLDTLRNETRKEGKQEKSHHKSKGTEKQQIFFDFPFVTVLTLYNTVNNEQVYWCNTHGGAHVKVLLGF